MHIPVEIWSLAGGASAHAQLQKDLSCPAWADLADPHGAGSVKGPAVAAPAHLGSRRGKGTCAATAGSTEAPGEPTLSQMRENTREYIAALP